MKKQSGFTLIELVVVIIVLGVLAATAVPKFVGLQDDARVGAINGLKGALETASTLTYAQAMLEGLGDSYDETLSSGIRIRYGYPFATQTNLKLVLSFSEDDWELTGSNPDPIVFTFSDDNSGCQLAYTRAVQGERPDISISGCTD